MRRALDPDRLSTALGGESALPSPDELARELADAEIRLFTQQAEVSSELLTAAWYLHSVAIARTDLNLYGTAQQRAAHQVSAHIFDVALQSRELPSLEELRVAVATQVGYLGGDLQPNATAIARRVGLEQVSLSAATTGTVSLQAAVLVLGLDRTRLHSALREWRAQLAGLSAEFVDTSDAPSGLVAGDLSDTTFGAVAGVVMGAEALLGFLNRGSQGSLETARRLFETALTAPGSQHDHDSRWVAAVLRRISDQLQTDSIWSVLPPDQSDAALAMTLGTPPVLTLWPPQVSLLAPADELSPILDDSVRRLVLSLPTSAGKTLLAQLMILSHLVADPAEVCVVVPTNSLCREIQGALRERLRVMGHDVYRDSWLGITPEKPTTARVTVLTPEKLSARLRADPSGTLSQFSMFVFDEAHLLSERGRGWELEATISFLHHATRDSRHRIVMLSAALGNHAHVRGWLDAGQGVDLRDEAWRAPRRLHVIYTAQPDWDAAEETPAQGAAGARRSWPLSGVLRLRTGDVKQRALSFTEPVGVLTQRQKRTGDWTTDYERSSKRAEIIGPLVRHLMSGGPVLVVASTRREAQGLASALAEGLEVPDATGRITELLTARLGEQHPIIESVRRGVAFHHAALPVDVQAEIEAEVRAGNIRCLVATTTLTEGINLPFRSVVIASRTYPGPDGRVEVIDGQRLLNAIGRAGRAGRETEGWLVLAEARRFDEKDFDALELSSADLQLSSRLATELDSLAAIEELLVAGADAAFDELAEAADGFLSYVWFVAEALDQIHGAVDLDRILYALRDTLAWQQLDAPARRLLEGAGAHAFELRETFEPDRRRRWIRAGSSFATARTLDGIAPRIVDVIQASEDLADAALLERIISEGTLDAVLGLRETPWRGFRPRPNSRWSQQLDVDVRAMVLDWVSGLDLVELADRHLASIDDEAWRLDQLSDFVSGVLEHALPWSLGTLTDWVNMELEARDSDQRLPRHLAGLVRFGVPDTVALEMMLAGVWSRRLANVVARDYSQAALGDFDDVRDWLGSLDLSEWRLRFSASPTELRDLMVYVRQPGAEVIGRILEDEALQVAISTQQPPMEGIEVDISRAAADGDPARLAVVHGEEILGYVPPALQSDIEFLLDSGLPISVVVASQGSDGQLVLNVRLAPTDTTGATA